MNNKININIVTPQIDYIDLQLFDAWYAYRQSLMVNYISDFNITVNEKNTTGINILLSYMPDQSTVNNIEDYDSVFLSNAGEPLFVHTEEMKKLLELDNVYLISNSYLLHKHPLYNKVLCFPHDLLKCRGYWTGYLYPQYFENFINGKLSRTNTLIGINGVARSNREYFFKLLDPSITVLASLHNANHIEQIFGGWNSIEDSMFQDWVNPRYSSSNLDGYKELYYSNSIQVGISQLDRRIPPGYFIMPEYFQHSCIIFPETGWQNNELTLTEKSLKCFYAGTLPFPIGGSNINKLYNELGFFTAWNLLPDDLQSFDEIEDHAERYKLAAKAINWLNGNRDIFKTEQYSQLTIQNKISFFSINPEFESISKLDNIIQKLVE